MTADIRHGVVGREHSIKVAAVERVDSSMVCYTILVQHILHSAPTIISTIKIYPVCLKRNNTILNIKQIAMGMLHKPQQECEGCNFAD